MMRMTAAGLRELAGHEGIVLTRYRDSVGVWTLGIGHTAAAGPPDPEAFDGRLGLADALALFARDVARYEDEVAAALRVPVAPHEFDALVSFHFNTGAITRAELTERLNAGDRVGAAERFMNWRKPAAIIPRREREQALFRDGVYAHRGRARLFEADRDGVVDYRSFTWVDLGAVPDQVA